MLEIQRELSNKSGSRRGKIKLKIGIGIVLIVFLMVWLLYEKFFAYTDNVKKMIEEQLGEPIQMIQLTKGDTTVIFASQASCERVQNIFGKWKAREKVINDSSSAASTQFYDKENFEVSFVGADKICHFDQSNEIKSIKSMRMVSGDIYKNYLINKNINKELQKIIEEKQSAPCFPKEKLLQLFHEETGKINEEVTLEDFEKYGQINVEYNGDIICMKICMEDSARLHVMFQSTELSKKSKPEKIIVFWSESEYKSSDQPDFLESIKEKL